MKKFRTLIALGAGIAIILLVTCLLLLSKDKTKPVITIPEGISYDGTQTDEELLKGVTAKDKRDGDVSDTLIVKSIIIHSDGANVKITYAAKDKSNNIAEKSIVIPYTGKLPVKPDKDTPKETKPEETKPEETKPEETKQEETKPEETEPEETTPIVTVSEEAPVLYLTQSEVTFKKGAEINWVKLVQDIKDNKDDRNSLFRSIMIENYPDVNTPGEYDTLFYCKDSDGNFSPKVTLHIIITE